MSGRSLLVIKICTLVIACSIAESLPGSKNGAGAAAASNASPEGFTAALAAGLSTHNGGVKQRNGGFGKPNHAVPVVAEVGSFISGTYGEGEGAAKISGSSDSGFGLGGTGAEKLNANVVEARTGQGSGSSVGK
ncbi:uncharacterized protein LOC124194598 [Daphnia pulex]|uniref:uncharacterized protein LOC124194598 n=1 Tax=Daphnia pulex TaxID=6669 RepID=UPI001EDFD951|nr:uncharacterized protein LOC124194598 [Daphnia pulex]